MKKIIIILIASVSLVGCSKSKCYQCESLYGFTEKCFYNKDEIAVYQEAQNHLQSEQRCQ